MCQSDSSARKALALHEANQDSLPTESLWKRFCTYLPIAFTCDFPLMALTVALAL